jgi:anaerobic selenocysteine-containing dehydrogenase
MPFRPDRSIVERIAVRLGVIPASPADATAAPADAPPTELRRAPAPETWHDHVEYDPHEWPKRAVARHYHLAPTTCFNCEAACGLLAFIDKQSGKIRKLEGNPLHPASRGKNCAKGPATINQVNDPDRILTPLKRIGKRGDGQWAAVSWEQALADIGGRVRRAIQEQRRDEIVYHVGRPGAEGFIDRVLRAWGVDGHNSHTNICSSGARLGYALWSGYDRPTPDYANARFILALNAHLESGHYFNPMAQRVMEGLSRGAKMAVVDPRLSNTASHAAFWLPCKPGTEAALLLAMARVILAEKLYDAAYVERWVNWRAWERENVGTCERDGTASHVPTFPPSHVPTSATVEDFFSMLTNHYRRFTPQFAEAECGIPAKTIERVARLIAEAGSRFCSHTWRGAASAHLGGWQVSRCLMLLHALTGSYGTHGGCLPAAWSKYKAHLFNVPPPQNHWNELHWPREYPLAHYEMSELLPHFLKDGRGRIDTYFTRVFNPVWTYPDGFTWIEALRDESKIGLHVALTPTWNETAFFADYVLPMGHGPERHDLNTYETHGATWIAFRQPVLKARARAEGRTVRDTRDVNPGQVWEEDEFWIALSWAVDPDGALGIRKYFESPQTPGTMLSVDEYYAHAFDRVPGLKDAAAEKNLTPLAYMQRFGAFEIKKHSDRRHERILSDDELHGSTTGDDGVVRSASGTPIGVRLPHATDGSRVVEGFATPSRKLEFFSRTMVEWGWPEYATPEYIPSHVYEPGNAATVESAPSHVPAFPRSRESFVLLPTFRLPTLIHTRSGSAKWLNEISQRNPIWLHTQDAARLGIATGDLVRVTTRIGHFVDRAWVTEGIRPGVVACSHHLGRWRRPQDPPNSRWSGSIVKIDERPAAGGSQWRMRQISGPQPFESPDPDSRRIWWRDGGVHQNITFPVQPDPISGMHCWHQQVTVEKAPAGDESGDVLVDTAKSMAIYREWLARTRWPVGPAPRSDGQRLRRPLWLNRPLRPADDAFWFTPD